MNITTRPATEDDKALARELHHLAYRDVAVRQFGQWDEVLQDGFFDEGWALGVYDVILLDGQPCGYTAIIDHEDHVQVLELVVYPDHQNKGIGTTIVQKAIERANARGVPARLSVLHENQAIKLYESLGFRETQRNDTHVGMERKIGTGTYFPTGPTKEENQNNAQ